jgi:hypothetical protein
MESLSKKSKERNYEAFENLRPIQAFNLFVCAFIDFWFGPGFCPESQGEAPGLGAAGILYEHHGRAFGLRRRIGHDSAFLRRQLQDVGEYCPPEDAPKGYDDKDLPRLSSQ